MPLFVDIHEIAGATVKEIADGHMKDAWETPALAPFLARAGATG